VRPKFEVAAIARGALGNQRSELGDLPLQAVFHARMAVIACPDAHTTSYCG
jgi:NTP pyrophosphatase (non-canonical NTP hydrolase)